MSASVNAPRDVRPRIGGRFVRADGSARVLPGTVFYATGVVFVVLGGLIAAVASPLGLYKGSWLAAYVVLVCGVSQAALGRAQASLPSRPLPTRLWQLQFVGWNLGNALVVAGTLLRTPFGVDLGGALLLVVVVSAGWALRAGVTRPWGWAYGALLVVLTVTVPIGLVLAHLRN